MHKATVIDLDGTLLNDNKKVGSEDLQTLYKLGENEIFRIIATGRSLYSFSEVLSDDFPIDYLIFAAGAGIMNFKTKEIINSYFLKANEVKCIAQKLIELKIDFQIRSKIPESHNYVYKKFSEKNPDFERVNILYKDYSRELTDNYSFEDAARFIAISPNDNIVNIIENEFDNFSIIRASSPIDNKSVWMEIYPPNVNKGSALRYLSNNLNISLSDTIGLGNDYNDIHFLDIVNEAYIVENAPEILKLKYKHTTNNNNNPLTKIFK